MDADINDLHKIVRIKLLISSVSTIWVVNVILK